MKQLSRLLILCKYIVKLKKNEYIRKIMHHANYQLQ